MFCFLTNQRWFGRPAALAARCDSRGAAPVIAPYRCEQPQRFDDSRRSLTLPVVIISASGRDSWCSRRACYGNTETVLSAVDAICRLRGVPPCIRDGHELPGTTEGGVEELNRSFWNLSSQWWKSPLDGETKKTVASTGDLRTEHTYNHCDTLVSAMSKNDMKPVSNTDFCADQILI